MDLTRIKSFLLHKEKIEKEEREAKRREILDRLDETAVYFEQYPAIERVYLYGSIVSGLLRRDSDVDIAIEGDPGYRNILRLFSDLSGVLPAVPDIRLMDEIPFSENVKKTGKIIYERKAASS